jgi:hypothetical protein
MPHYEGRGQPQLQRHAEASRNSCHSTIKKMLKIQLAMEVTNIAEKNSIISPKL